MEDRETPRMRKYGESKMTRIVMATVPHVTSGSWLRKFQADGFLVDRVYVGASAKTTSKHPVVFFKRSHKTSDDSRIMRRCTACHRDTQCTGQR